MTLIVLDPTPETEAPVGRPAPRLAQLAGATIGFVSNGKEGTRPFFAHLGRMLVEEHGIREVVLRTKSNYSAPADGWITEEMRRWDAVVAGIGD